MTESIDELQQARDALRQNLQDVEDNIKKLTGRDPDEGRRLSTPRRIQLKRNSYGKPGGNQQPPAKRTLNERRRWGNSALTAQNNLDSGGEEEEKKKPAVHSSVVATGNPIESLKRPVLEDTQTKKRNQRMFGLLLGTLKQFKQESKLKSEQESKQEEKLQKVEEQVEKDKEDAIRERKELYQSRRDKQNELKKVEFKIEMAELVVDLKSHYGKMKDFIQLKSTPRLFYKPSIHNKKTTKLLQNSKETLQEYLEQRLKEIDMCTEEDLFQIVRQRRSSGRIHGKSAKDPIVIDAVPPNRDLFAEDAEIEKREREADELAQAKSVVNEASNNEIPVFEDVVMKDTEVKEGPSENVITIDNNNISNVGAAERVVINGNDIREVKVDKNLNDPINVQNNVDSRRVVTDYSVVDERVVELSSSSTDPVVTVSESAKDVDIYDGMQDQVMSFQEDV